MSTLFSSEIGVIPALDIKDLEKARNIVSSTSLVPGIVGYKIGWMLGLRFGLRQIVETLRYSGGDAVIMIYDHQKAGNDPPDFSGQFAELMAEAKVQGAILFPFAGKKTQEELTKALFEVGVTPIVGGHMTQDGFLVSEEGYVADESPEIIYGRAAQQGVRDFIFPGNRVDFVKKYRELLDREIGPGQFTVSSPGFINQGGVPSEAARMAGPRFNGIFGRQFTESEDPKTVAETLTSQLVIK